MSSSEFQWVAVSSSEFQWVPMRHGESKWVQVSPSESSESSESKWAKLKWARVGPSETKWIQERPPLPLTTSCPTSVGLIGVYISHATLLLSSLLLSCMWCMLYALICAKMVWMFLWLGRGPCALRQVLLPSARTLSWSILSLSVEWWTGQNPPLLCTTNHIIRNSRLTS